MKKILSVLGAVALIGASSVFVSCDGLLDGDEINNYATTTVDAVSFTTAKAGPGVNVLKWNAVNDVSSYTVYRTVSGGHVEEVVRTASSNLYFIDKNIEAGKSYTYRVVANPTNDNVRDASSKSVTLSTGTWPAEGTTFDALEGGTTNGLASDKITVKLYPTSTGNSVRASFPVKPYASYTVYLSQVNGGLVNNSDSRDDSKTVYGYDFDGTATVDLTALYAGEKQVTVVATPLNTTLYGRSVHVAAATVEVLALDDISSAVSGSVSASWTNYSSYTNIATARVWFTPASFNDEEFATTEYTIYRALYTSGGETVAIDESTSTRVYTSITALGNPVKDTTVDSSDDTVYYLDDSGIDLSYANDIAGVRYFVVLNHNGKFKTQTTVLTVPSSSDDNWNFVPDTDSSTTVENDVKLYDIYIESDGVFYLKAYDDYAYGRTLSVTYGMFDTLNEALTAVNSELPTSMTLDSDTDSSNYPVYYGTTTTTATDGTSTTTKTTVDTSKYYAFRVLSTKTGAADDVVTTVAQPQNVNNAYYFKVYQGYPTNYTTVGTPSFYDLSKTLGSEKYESISFDFSASNAVYCNVYRYISSYSYYDAADVISYGSLLKTVTASSGGVSDSSIDTELDNYVYYAVQAVGAYGVSTSYVRVSGLAAPTIVYNGDGTITWSSVSGATGYYVYFAKTLSELNALSDSASSREYVSTSSYTVAESSFSDYYYAVKAYRSSDGTYSNYSNVVTVDQTDVEFDLYSYSGSSDQYTWQLSWNAEPGYSRSYRILEYTTSDTSVDEDAVKTLFEESPSSYYNYSSTSSTSYTLYNSSSTNRKFVAVATYSNYTYTVSEVNEVLYKLSDTDITVSGSSGSWTLDWDAITYEAASGATQTAAAYAVYTYTDSSTWYSPMDDLESMTPTIVTTNSATSTSESYYKFFLVVALSEEPSSGATSEDILLSSVGYTNIAYKSGY